MKLLIVLLLVSCSQIKKIKYKEAHPEIKASPDQALVYFLRTKNLAGINFIINDHLREQDKKQEVSIGVISSNSFFSAPIAPGKHVFSYATSFRKDKAEFELSVEKAKTYYIEMTEIETGSYPTTSNTRMITTDAKFVVLPETTALEKMKEMHEVDLEANKAMLGR